MEGGEKEKEEKEKEKEKNNKYNQNIHINEKTQICKIIAALSSQ